jgi:hypothetical protein
LVGGTCKYVTRDGGNSTDKWLIEDFCLQIATTLGSRVAVLLVKALLWAINDPTMLFVVPNNMRNNLTMRYKLVRKLEVYIDPIEKTPVTVFSV